MKITLACPFCDENTRIMKKIVSPGKIYVKRRCSMGHEVWSVEEIPENQAKVEDEISAIKEYSRQKRLKAMREKARARAKAKKMAKRVSSI